MLEKAIDLLQQLGFTSYESKAYIGVLENQPVGAYELAKRSNVPTSKIYETVNKLLKRGAIQFSESDGADNPSYVALPPQDLSEQLNREIQARTSALLPILDELKTSQVADFIWPLASLEALKDKATGMIQSAQKSLLISCWPQELEWLYAPLAEAHGNGVAVAVVHFGIPDKTIGATYHHPAEKTLYEEKGGRGLTLVADSKEVVIAHLARDKSLNSCWSKNSAFVTVAEDYVKHDVYITKVTKHLKQEVLDRYGSEYEQLRDIFNPEA